MSGMSVSKISTIDMECLSALSSRLPFIDENILSKTKYYPNSSMYSLGNTYRYYEFKIENGERKYFLSSFSKNGFVDNILNGAEKGAEFHELVEVLTKADIQEDEAKSYILSLINHQILISEYSVSLTGEDYLSRLIKQIEKKKQPFHAAIAGQLKLIKDTVGSTRSAIEKHDLIKDYLKEIIPDIAVKETVHTDTFFNFSQNTINESFFKDMLYSIEKLSVFNNSHLENNSDLKRFKESFYKKYEDQWIPLSEALDPETGIGYGIVAGENTNFTPLIDDLILPEKHFPETTQWTSGNHFILKKFIECKQYEIAITDKDIEDLNKEYDNINLQPANIYPNTFSILGSVIANDFNNENGWKFLLKSCGGTDAISLLSRFGTKNENIRQAILSCAKYEEQNQSGDKIFAEIVHIPEGNVGNVLLRPSIFNYEIPFLAMPSMSKDFVIPVWDIYVAVRNNRIALQSAKLGKEIIPRLSSAHNFGRGLPMYKFLCDVQQQQGSFFISWDWDFLHEQPFLPRVSYKNIILKRARWFIKKKEFEEFCTHQQATDSIDFLIRQHSIPSVVLLIEGDNELLLDLSLTIAKTILISKLKKGNIILYEFLFNKEAAFLSDKNKLYANEIVIPVKNIQTNASPINNLSPVLFNQTQRSFALGSEWVYVKIYTGNKSADYVLGTSIQKLIERLKRKQLIEQWFFIRYGDPENHIRLRLKRKNTATGLQAIIKEINRNFESYTDAKFISGLVYDTYQPEIEKYGLNTIELCEEFFHRDSEFVLHIIHNSGEKKPDEDRWLFALKGVHILLDDFGLSLKEKADFCNLRRISFLNEFNGNKSLTEQLNNKYRSNSKIIQDALTRSETIFSQEIEMLFKQKSDSNKQIFSQIFTILQDKKNYQVSKEQLLMNFIHLFINRIFVANQRLYELVIYHYLMKYYASALAREKSVM
jgi:thiopeptide-type bacteriocin biosynthesis protein